MFIKFDDLEMLEFFENEPIFIGEEFEGNVIYSTKDNFQLSMKVTIDTYAKTIEISVRYQCNTVFSGKFDKVLEIKKNQDVLLIEMEDKKRLVIKKFPCVGIILEAL